MQEIDPPFSRSGSNRLTFYSRSRSFSRFVFHLLLQATVGDTMIVVVVDMTDIKLPMGSIHGENVRSICKKTGTLYAT